MDQIEHIKLKELISEEEIRKRISELARDILQNIQAEELIIIGLLTGSFVFLADLIRECHKHRPLYGIDFMTVSSYGSKMHSSDNVRIDHDIRIDIANKAVLLVDDILDTGQTLQAVVHHLRQKNPEKIRTCVMLDKSEARKVDITADYVGFKISNAFVVGYGLDYDNRFRELSYIATVS